MGHCGSVWANPDTTLRNDDAALKHEDGGPGRSLANEHAVHAHLLDALRALGKAGRDDALGRVAQINMPFCHGFLRAVDVDAWGSILPNLPVGYTRCNALVSERIPSTAPAVRRLLVDRFCPEALRDAIVADRNNDDCLVRPYLGRRRHVSRPSRFSAFSLRNFPLHADQMEELGLDLAGYARTMAGALAFMHWCARIDAKDVEFVLAPGRKPADGANSPELRRGTPFTAGQLGQHALWMLDFDCCRSITLDQDGVGRTVTAFYRNDPFYPLPGRPKNSVDAALWQVFCDHYLATSQKLLADESPEIWKLPSLLTEQLVQRAHGFRTSPLA